MITFYNRLTPVFCLVVSMWFKTLKMEVNAQFLLLKVRFPAPEGCKRSDHSITSLRSCISRAATL